MPTFENRPEVYQKIPVTSLRDSHKEEQRMLNSAVERQRDSYKSPIIRLSAGKSVVNYYKQTYLNKNNRVKANHSENTIDPNTTQFTEIKNLVVHFDPKNVDQQESETSRSFDENGVIYILPDTIFPDAGDYIEISHLGRYDLLRVTDVRFDEVEKRNGFAIDYVTHRKSYDRDDSDQNPTKDRIFESYIFKQEHIGTDHKTLFKTYEDQLFKDLIKMYNRLGTDYYRIFFDNIRSSYFLTFEDEIPDAETFARDESAGKNPDRVKDRNEWVRVSIYDRELMEFISKHRIFDYINDTFVSPSKYFESSPRSYHHTIFYALERSNFTLFKKGYIEVNSITSTNDASERMLYGFGDARHVIGLDDGILTLLPPGFLTRLSVTPDTSDMYKNRTQYDPVDYLIDIINCFLNRRSVSFDHVVERLEHMRKSHIWDDLFALDIRPEYKFYLFPILGYVLSITLGTLSSKNTNKDEWIL